MAESIRSGGCPAGTHQGIAGAMPATSTKVSSLRVTQPLILGFGVALRQTKYSQASSPNAMPAHPYNEAFTSSHNHARNSQCPGFTASSGNMNHPINPFAITATDSVDRLIS